MKNITWSNVQNTKRVLAHVPPFESYKVLGAWRSTLAVIIYKLKYEAHEQPTACAVYKGKSSSMVALRWKWGCVFSIVKGFSGLAESFGACSGSPSSLCHVGN